MELGSLVCSKDLTSLCCLLFLTEVHTIVSKTTLKVCEADKGSQYPPIYPVLAELVIVFTFPWTAALNISFEVHDFV